LKTLKALFLGLAMMVLARHATAQLQKQVNSEYSLMIFNFVKFIQWPASDESKDFVIGIVGNTEIYNTLASWYWGAPDGYKNYVIRNFEDASEVTDCQLVFIDESKSREFKTVNNAVKGKGTLVVTDSTGLGAKGSCINFKRTVGEKLRFELNQQAVSSLNLKVAGALTRIAIVI
jgi:hypothetical protein